MDALDHKEKKEKWVPRDEEARREKKEMEVSVPVVLVPWDLLVLQDFLEDRGVKETWAPLAGMGRKVTLAHLVLWDLLG